MTGREKFALVKALHDARMGSRYPPQAQAWITQQFTCCVIAVMDALRLDTLDRSQFEHIINRDNFIPQDNPFKDDDA